MSDPEHWQRRPLPVELKTKISNYFRASRPKTMSRCVGDDDKLVPVDVNTLKVTVPTVYGSLRGAWLLWVEAGPTPTCDDPFSKAYEGWGDVYVVTPVGEIPKVKAAGRPLDAGDYDGDGKSEWLFEVGDYDGDGYVITWDDFQQSARWMWSYH